MEKKQNQSGEMESMACGGCKKGRTMLPVVLISLLILNLLTTAGLGFAMHQFKNTEFRSIQDGGAETMRQIEYDRVGGKEVFDLITQVQKLSAPQTKQQIQAAIVKLGGAAQQPADATTATPAPAATSNTSLSDEEYAAVIKDSYAEGKKNAKITLVEYSDLECPYCIIQFKNKTISQLQEKYGDSINVIYKPLNLAGHPGSDQKGWASLCVAQVGGTDKYAKFYKAILDRSNERGPVFPLDNLKSLAKEVGVDATKFAQCYDGKKTESLYKSYTNEAIKHGVDGTPTTMILNNETKKFELVKGAADVSAFYPVVDRMMK